MPDAPTPSDELQCPLDEQLIAVGVRLDMEPIDSGVAHEAGEPLCIKAAGIPECVAAAVAADHVPGGIAHYGVETGVRLVPEYLRECERPMQETAGGCDLCGAFEERCRGGRWQRAAIVEKQIGELAEDGALDGRLAGPEPAGAPQVEDAHPSPERGVARRQRRKQHAFLAHDGRRRIRFCRQPLPDPYGVIEHMPHAVDFKERELIRAPAAPRCPWRLAKQIF